MSEIKKGIDTELEAAADALIFGQAATQSRADKLDILTPWKEQDRRSREVYARRPIDPGVRRGMFHRARNEVQSHLNSRDCIAPARIRSAHLGADEQWETD